jgi:hypothetical protein
MKVIQHSFVPDNDRETTQPKPSVPVAKYIDGRWCWKRFGEDVWVYEPALEAILLGAHRKAA